MGVSTKQYNRIKYSKICDHRYYINYIKQNNIMEYSKVKHMPTIAAGSSNGVTNTRCCRYSCMRS